MERVLCIGNYSKLHKLNLINLEIEMAYRIFNEENFVYPPLLLIDLPFTVFYSSKIVELNVRVRNFDDCLCLLDGRLCQLHTFIVKIDKIQNSSKTLDNKKILYNLKCFSLISSQTNGYDTKIVPLLHHMSQLEKLTLSLVVRDRTSFIDGTQLHNDILHKMAHLRIFTFDIVTRNVIFSQGAQPSSDDVRCTFVERRYYVNCYIDYYSQGINLCHIYSLPFTMKRMRHIPFEHDFFVKISKSFPLISQLALLNVWKQEKKTRLPSLNTLYVNYQDLMTTTEDYTNDLARENCAKVKNIIFDTIPIVYSENFYLYFPSL
ncbi:unnamed protein product [Rotaria sordida]|uniref:Uncharacterized protein n=2 Tax=Rotaria sordida TaxID=392033 RepID=A0A819BE49_9BILA|nr:unnamed protein product [Rotaria sordida]